MEGTFATDTKSTIAAAFMTKRVVVNGRKLRLQIWDTAGQERFRSMAPMYYRGASGAVLVYDVTNSESLDAVRAWVQELRNNSDDEMVISLAGNKCDLASNREVRC